MYETTGENTLLIISNSYISIQGRTSKYFSYIEAVSFIDVGNRSTRSKPQTYRKSDTLYHIMLYRVHLASEWFELTALVVIGTDCIGSCKSNFYHIMLDTLRFELTTSAVIGTGCICSCKSNYHTTTTTPLIYTQGHLWYTNVVLQVI
jgi:hypothetical protein